MKAISLWQPWASLVSIGAKAYETRSWTTAYRGPLLIHAAQRFRLEERQLALTLRFRGVLQQAGYDSTYKLPLGTFVAVAKLVDIVPTADIRGSLSDQELAFGDYTPGRFAWKLEGIKAFPEPVTARGYQGLWDPLAGLDGPRMKLIRDLFE